MTKGFPHFWWMNNSRDYKKGKEMEYLWTAKKNKIGRVNPTWMRLREIKEGDVIFHYIGNWQINAVSIAESDCYDAVGKTESGKVAGGQRVDLNYFEIDTINLSESKDVFLNIAIRNIGGQPPFYKSKQGKFNHYYGLVFNFSFEAAKILREIYGRPFPEPIERYFRMQR